MSRPTQTREKLLAVLGEAGSQGMATKDLVQSLKGLGVVLKPKSWEMMLARDCKNGYIAGKGAYMPGEKGIRFRYFLTREWCDAYVFEGALDPAQREERARELSRLRSERRRKAKPKQVKRRVLKTLSREDQLAADREYRREYRARMRQKRIEAGEVIRPMAPRGQGVKALRKAARELARSQAQTPRKPVVRRAARPGSEQVVRDSRVAAPVEVRKREVLSGPVDYSKARITVAPVGIDYRYHVDPDRVERVFSAIPIGRYLEETEESV